MTAAKPTSKDRDSKVQMHPVFKHLTLECGNTMGSKTERLGYLGKEHWVPYPQAKRIMKRMERMLKGNDKRRKAHLLIKADSNNGKSYILEEFEVRHPPQDNPLGEGIIVPYLLIEMPPRANDLMIYNEILKKLRASHKGKIQGQEKHLQVLYLMEQVGVKMLGFDELGNLSQGSDGQRKSVLNTLKYIGNSLKIPIAAAAVPSVENYIQTDDQWDNRFHREELPRWSLNQDFANLLASFEKQLPLPEPSNLGTTPELVLTLFNMSGGLIGELATILSEVTESAIENNHPCITKEMLDRHEWKSPSHRRGG